MAYDQPRTGSRQGQARRLAAFSAAVQDLCGSRGVMARPSEGAMGQTLHLGNADGRRGVCRPHAVRRGASRTTARSRTSTDSTLGSATIPIVDSVYVYNVSELLTRPIGVLDVHEPVRCGARVVARPASRGVAAESVSARGVRLREQAGVLSQQLSPGLTMERVGTRVGRPGGRLLGKPVERSSSRCRSSGTPDALQRSRRRLLS